MAACRAFALDRLDYGFAGHLTVRDPERPHLYWTNPMAVHFAQVKVSNLILVDHDGQVVEGELRREPRRLRAARGGARDAPGHRRHVPRAHGLRRRLRGARQEARAVTQDAAVFYEDHVVIADEGGKVAVEVKAGHNVAAAFKGVKAAIHQNHGLLTASRHSIDAAAFWFIGLERCCHQQLMIDASGVAPKLVPPEKARYSREHVGSDYIGWLHFQPVYDHLAKTQPDMFD